jgi:hypothetical protein
VSTEQIWVWLIGMVNAPFVVLCIMLWGFWRAVKVADMAKDVFHDREVVVTICVMGSWILSSWYLMADQVLERKGNAILYGMYLATWSGAPIFIKALDKWDGSFKGKAPP